MTVIYSASDLKNRRVEVLEAANKGQAIVRAVDGTALEMTRLDEVERARAVAHWCLLLHRSQESAAGSRLMWLSHLDVDDQAQCLRELWDGVEALNAGALDQAQMDDLVNGWRVAAISLADDRRRGVLLSDVSEGDFIEVGRPK